MEEPLWRNVAKYFLHGILFSVIFFALAFVWFAFSAMLVVVGGLIGLVIAFVVLFFILGGLNSVLAVHIWDISTKDVWWGLLGHGFLLFIILAVVHIPIQFANLAVPDLTMMIVLFVIEAFIDGVVAKNVARFMGFL